mmetsp:Transcript_13833/g.24801  ORF Transcript_13833/g.24801 Transcript_13833/m.24801 type:complete len:337 (-) Transcript_13833:160-1170(-)
MLGYEWTEMNRGSVAFVGSNVASRIKHGIKYQNGMCNDLHRNNTCAPRNKSSGVIAMHASPRGWRQFEKVYTGSPGPIEMSAASYHIEGTTCGRKTDAALVLEDEGIFGIADSKLCDADAFLQSILSSVASEEKLSGTLLKLMSNALNKSSDGTEKLSSVLCKVIQDQSVMEIAWIGSAGWMLLRDGIIQGEWVAPFPSKSLEKCFELHDSEYKQDNRAHQNVQFQRIALQDGDLIILGSDGFFDNLGDEQLMAYLRPMPEKHSWFSADLVDARPPICLATWTSDDPVFLSYMLAHLAHNFACNSGAKSYLGRRFVRPATNDDVSVLVAAVSSLSA